ncbi:hypothetical protein GF380_05580 [Candidatus Uhrbacteria bacterium]|nr:hypothetical protein [Candidatus Uhrbacteria bacterium]
MTQRSWPWFGEAPGDGPDAGAYEIEDWWPVWAVLAKAAGLVVEGAGSPLRTLSSLGNIGIFYIVPNRLEVTDAGGLAVDVNTGAALVEGQFYYNDTSVQLTLPASQTDYYVVLRKNYTGTTYTPPGYTAGSGEVEGYTTRITWVSAIVQSTDRTTYWDVPLAKFTTNAADITSLSDEREYIDAGTIIDFIPSIYGYIVTVGLTRGDALEASFDEPGGLEMPDNESARAIGTYKIPHNFIKDLDTKCILVPEASGDVVIRNWTEYGGCGELHSVHEDETAVLGFANTIAITDSERNCIDEMDFNDASANDFVTIITDRSGSDASDTINASVNHMGWRVTYFGYKTVKR